MRFWKRFTAGRNSVNGHAPDPPPATPTAIELAPVVPPTEPRMSTDLGDALTAYWRSGQWWGGPQLVRWLINNGHMSEAAYVLGEVMKVTRMPEKQRRVLLRQGKRLQALERRAQERPTLHRPDAPPSGQPGQHPSSTTAATSGAPPGTGG